MRLRLLALSMVILAACSPSPSPAPAGSTAASGSSSAPVVKTTPTLRIAVLADESMLTPYTYRFGYPGLQMVYLVYDTLLQLDSENIAKPLLAASIATSPDALSYDVTLRPNVTFHDGKPLTSDDVKFTYEYFLKNPMSSFTTPLRQVDSITASSPTSLKITLKAPNPSFPIRALATVPILPKHLWEPVDGAKVKEFAAKVGSGPYTLVDANVDSGYRLQANAKYFLGAPTVNELVFPIIKDQNTAFQALRSGEIQAVSREVPSELVPQFNQAPFKIAKGPGFASTMLQINDEKPGLDKREVRQAIDYAIDKKKLVDTVLLGLGTVATPGFIHPSSPFHDSKIAARFDLAQSKKLLDGIGATPGADGIRVLNGAPMRYTLLVYSNVPARVRSAELIAAMLKDAGIAIDVKAMDSDSVDALVWPEFDVAKGRNFDLAMWGWSAPLQVDIGRLIDLVHSDVKVGTNNIGGFKSAEADGLADKLRTTTDDAARKTLAQSLEQSIATDLPFVMLYFGDGQFAYRAEAFDAWQYQKGTGIFTKLSYLPAPFGR